MRRTRAMGTHDNELPNVTGGDNDREYSPLPDWNGYLMNEELRSRGLNPTLMRRLRTIWRRRIEFAR